MTLEEAVAAAATLEGATLRKRLEWLESAALAAETADIGPAGADGALLLRAALGAIVKFSQQPGDQAALGELEVVVKALTAKALLALTGALADTYDALSDKGGVHREACKDAALAYRETARALQRGEGVPESARARIAKLDAALRLK